VWTLWQFGEICTFYNSLIMTSDEWETNEVKLKLQYNMTELDAMKVFHSKTSKIEQTFQSFWNLQTFDKISSILDTTYIMLRSMKNMICLKSIWYNYSVLSLIAMPKDLQWSWHIYLILIDLIWHVMVTNCLFTEVKCLLKVQSLYHKGLKAER